MIQDINKTTCTATKESKNRHILKRKIEYLQNFFYTSTFRRVLQLNSETTE